MGLILTATDNNVSIDDVGSKAYRLMELSRWSRDGLPFRVPQFCVVPAGISADYYSRRGFMRSPTFDPLPVESHIPMEAVEYFDGFYEDFSPAFDSCMKVLETAHSIYIGSSIVLGTGVRLSYAGLNSRTTPRVVTPGMLYTKTGVERAMAGLFRPYAELYLRAHGLDQPNRIAGIMFYEYIDAEFEAVAHIAGDTVWVECKPLRGNALGFWSDVSFPLFGNVQWPDYWNANNRGERVRQAFQALVSVVSRCESDWTEIEFCFTDSGELFILQYRQYSVSQKDHGEAQNTRITFSGNAVSLLSEPLSRGLVEWIRAYSDSHENDRPIWLVNRHGLRWDGFRLLWVLTCLASGEGIRIVLCHGLDRQPSHITTALRENPRVESYSEVEYEGVRILPRESQITVSFRPTPRPIATIVRSGGSVVS
jgi:hypothetical protein